MYLSTFQASSECLNDKVVSSENITNFKDQFSTAVIVNLALSMPYTVHAVPLFKPVKSNGVTTSSEILNSVVPHYCFQSIINLFDLTGLNKGKAWTVYGIDKTRLLFHTISRS